VLQAARSPRFAHLVATLVALSVPALGLGAGCATSTEFIKEGPGQPSDRASGAVPDGALGVCKVPLSKRPPLVNASLWEHAKNCNAKTPERFLRLGYGNSAGADDAAAADQEMASLLETLRDGAKVDGGNQKMVTLMRKLRELAIKDEDLRDRVSKATARTAVCDYTYMLNVMEREHLALSKDDACALRVYDPREKTEVCLFDTQLAEGRWLTSAWDCVAGVNAVGEEQSCHRLCGYDDYCTMQVSCAAGDLDLLLCVLGVCAPEPRAGF
jgi:hypothetical protein